MRRTAVCARSPSDGGQEAAVPQADRLPHVRAEATGPPMSATMPLLSGVLDGRVGWSVPHSPHSRPVGVRWLVRYFTHSARLRVATW